MVSSSKDIFVNALKAKLRSNKKPLKIKRVKSLYPWAIEKQYAKMILKWLSPLHNQVMEYLKEQGETILKGDSVEHVDNTPGIGARLLLSMSSGWIGQYFPDNPNYSPANIMLGLGEIADSTHIFTAKQWEKQTKSLLGFKFQGNEMWWGDLKPQWETRNIDIVKSLATDYVGKMNDLAEKAIVNGWNKEQLINEMKKLGPDAYRDKDGAKRPGFMEWKSRLIARDQIGKLNGLISQSEQEEIGLQTYEWDTAGDERVRGKAGGHFANATPSHWAMQGVVCRWDNSGVYSLDNGATWIPRAWNMPSEHPGMAIQCRCIALPYWNDLLDEIEQEE